MRCSELPKKPVLPEERRQFRRRLWEELHRPAVRERQVADLDLQQLVFVVNLISECDNLLLRERCELLILRCALQQVLRDA